MAGADDQEKDLSGTWHGQYRFPYGRPPVFFQATLAETTGFLTGTCSETVNVRRAGMRTLQSVFDGRRERHSVTFLKLYDLSHRGYDTVHYVGTISADGNEIEGTWTVPGSWSGTFLMIRASGIAVPAARQVAEKV